MWFSLFLWRTFQKRSTTLRCRVFLHHKKFLETGFNSIACENGFWMLPSVFPLVWCFRCYRNVLSAFKAYYKPVQEVIRAKFIRYAAVNVSLRIMKVLGRRKKIDWNTMLPFLPGGWMCLLNLTLTWVNSGNSEYYWNSISTNMIPILFALLYVIAFSSISYDTAVPVNNAYSNQFDKLSVLITVFIRFCQACAVFLNHFLLVICTCRFPLIRFKV